MPEALKSPMKRATVDTIPAAGEEPGYFAGIAEASRELVATLTPRETEVTRLMAFGQKNHEIARKLGISVKTLDIHRTNVKRKLKAKTVVAVALAWLAAKGLLVGSEQ